MPRRAVVDLAVESVLALSGVAAVLLAAPRPVQVAAVIVSSVASAVIAIRADHHPYDDASRAVLGVIATLAPMVAALVAAQAM